MNGGGWWGERLWWVEVEVSNSISDPDPSHIFLRGFLFHLRGLGGRGGDESV